MIELVLLWVRSIAGRVRAMLTYGVPGQSMVEYGIVVALIAIVAFVVIQSLGQNIAGVFQNILNKLQALPT
ncbi:MAG: Flp family type IVb pilin [Chloroflexota bacterium]|nr:Flp family type IVb pilin [Chloroflexota bacterium]